MGDADEERLRSLLSDELVAHPPVIGVAGVSGAGKTATIDALFRAGSPVAGGSSRTVSTPLRAAPGSILYVVDAPGMGEDDTRDAEMLAMYDRELWACDVLLWVFPARGRAVALDQRYLARLAGFADRMVFGVNQVDLVEPGDWDVVRNSPSERQAARITDVVAHRSAVVSRALGKEIDVVPYSATTGYRLDDLYDRIADAVPGPRRPLFDMVRRAPGDPAPGAWR